MTSNWSIWNARSKTRPENSPAEGELGPGTDELWELDRVLKKVVASVLYWVSGLLVMVQKFTAKRKAGEWLT